MVDTNPNPNPKTAFLLKKIDADPGLGPGPGPGPDPDKDPDSSFYKHPLFLSGQTIPAANKLLIKIILTSSWIKISM